MDYQHEEIETDRLMDQQPQWLTSEARRIRRQRQQDMIDAILLGAFAVVGVFITLEILGILK